MVENLENLRNETKTISTTTIQNWSIKTLIFFQLVAHDGTVHCVFFFPLSVHKQVKKHFYMLLRIFQMFMAHSIPLYHAAMLKWIKS